MEFDKVVDLRKSVRSFKDKKVDFADVLEAIDAAIKGPFAGNMNNLKFLIVEDEKMIKEIAKHSDQTWINEAPVAILVCSDETHLENQFGERGRVYSRQQAGAAVNTMTMKLAELGISSCWVGAYTDEILRELLKIPGHINIEAIIPAGYEKNKTKKPRKQALENVLRWENWNNLRRPTLFEEALKEQPYK